MNAKTMTAWTPGRVAAAIALFVLAGFLEITGCYLFWVSFRGTPRKHWALSVAGAVSLAAYGAVFLAMPMSDFGRIMAVYGGFFIALSYAFGAAVDGFVMDAGDWIGASVALIGVLIAMFWPRHRSSS